MILFIHIFIEKMDLSFVFIFPNETIKRKKRLIQNGLNFLIDFPEYDVNYSDYFDVHRV